MDFRKLTSYGTETRKFSAADTYQRVVSGGAARRCAPVALPLHYDRGVCDASFSTRNVLSRFLVRLHFNLD